MGSIDRTTQAVAVNDNTSGVTETKKTTLPSTIAISYLDSYVTLPINSVCKSDITTISLKSAYYNDRQQELLEDQWNTAHFLFRLANNSTDAAKAYNLLELSAQLGYGRAQYRMGSLCEQSGNISLAYGWYQLAASNGVEQAVSVLERLEK